MPVRQARLAVYPGLRLHVLTIHQLQQRFGRPGRLLWIGTRPARDQDMQSHQQIVIDQAGLTGDRYRKVDGDRAVTLIQQEHLAVIAKLQGIAECPPALVRRNIVVAGINLLALRNQRFYLGEVLLEGTGLCHPCSKMESLLGLGGYNAMRGHGGLTARVLQGGACKLNDEVTFATNEVT